MTGGYKVYVNQSNNAPTLNSISNVTMKTTTDYTTITLSGSDADGDKLTYTATAYQTDTVAQKAYNLDQQLGLYAYNNNYYTNLTGAR